MSRHFSTDTKLLSAVNDSWSKSPETGAQPGILFGKSQSLTSSDFKLWLFCTKIILMSLVNFCSITTG